MDTMDVQIFKIISDNCTHNHIVSASGCDPKYLQEAEKIIPKGVWEG